MIMRLECCPYCNTYNLIVDRIPFSDWYYANCVYARGGCGMNGPWGVGVDEAVRKWNEIPRRERVQQAEAQT